MAAIWKRGNYWRAYIRRQGYPQQNRTFDTRVDAEAWARRIESEMDRGAFVDRTAAEITSFGDLLKRYAEEISPPKKGGDGEILRIRKLRKDKLADYKISALTGKVIAEYRDARLRLVTGSTVNRELTLIGHVITIARKEWGIPLEINPVSMIRRPDAPCYALLRSFSLPAIKAASSGLCVSVDSRLPATVGMDEAAKWTVGPFVSDPAACPTREGLQCSPESARMRG